MDIALVQLIERFGLPMVLVVIGIAAGKVLFKRALETEDWIKNQLIGVITKNTESQSETARAVNSLERTLQTWAADRPCLIQPDGKSVAPHVRLLPKDQEAKEN